MEDDIQGGAVSIDMGGAVQSFMQVRKGSSRNNIPHFN